MKKLNIMIFIIITVLIFSSCGQKDEAQTDLNNTINNQYLSESSNDIDVSPSVEDAVIGLYSEDEYEKYIADAKLPDSFILYDELSHIGAFDSVVFLENANELKYNSYMYTLIGSNEKIYIYVYHSGAQETISTNNQPVIMTNGNTDLRSLSDTTSGVYIEGDAKYTYVLGNLHTIEWTTSDVTYVMYTSDGLSKYNSGNYFINSMLNKEEVASAISYFDEQLRTTK